MLIRLVSTTLWFVTVLMFYELAWSIAGVPRPLGPLVALGVAGFVAVDPLHRIWLARPRAAASHAVDLALPTTLPGEVLADPNHSDRAA